MLDRQLASTQTLQLAGLHTLDIFYTPLEGRFDRLTRLARVALGVPAAGITLFGEDRVWFKSVNGWDIQELPPERSFCRLLIGRDEPLVVDDTRLDADLRHHPLVAEAPRFRFYAGYPLLDRQGRTAGSLCAFDTRPRTLGPTGLQILRDLGELAQREILANEIRDAQAELVAKLDIARRQAMIDVLTRIWNRRAGLQFLDDAVERTGRDGRPLSIALLDCDSFKTVNDQHGHPVGDKILRKVAATIVGNLREGDIVCRLGGDEFMIVMAGADHEAATVVARRVQTRVGEFPLKTGSGPVPIAVSFGIATLDAGDQHAAATLIERADQALLAAKAGNTKDGRRMNHAAA
jgi:diguanylate cyclase (GGDEF)-like protein